MKVLNSQQMKEIDKKAIEEIGIIGPILMENAGLQIVKEIKARFPQIKDEKIIIVAGKGNNGGDGLVVARHLLNQRCESSVLVLARKKELKGDAALNLRTAEKIGVKITEVTSLKEWESHKKNLFPYFKSRKKDSHKGTYGHLLILSGSLGKTGAAAMAAKAALKMGASLVTVGTPESCLPIVARSMVELMTEPLPETSERTLSSEALERILDLLEGKDALMIGPGISTHPSTSELVLSLIPKINIPAVIDADALNILASNPELFKSLSQPAILTPHPGEFARLLDLSTRDVVENKLELVPQFTEEYGVYLVLKSYKTLIANPEGAVFINPTGNPGMATAGAGNVLSGMIASMITQEEDLLEAILAAVYVHGLSGDIGVEKLGERALTAGNIITYLPSALKRLSSAL